MPVITCNGCGGITNTAVSEWDYRNLDKGATRCYGKWVDGKWTKGCAYGAANTLHKTIVDGFIKKRGGDE
jgi:hypothetical protein